MSVSRSLGFLDSFASFDKKKQKNATAGGEKTTKAVLEFLIIFKF